MGFSMCDVRCAQMHDDFQPQILMNALRLGYVQFYFNCVCEWVACSCNVVYVAAAKQITTTVETARATISRLSTRVKLIAVFLPKRFKLDANKYVMRRLIGCTLNRYGIINKQRMACVCACAAYVSVRACERRER